MREPPQLSARIEAGRVVVVRSVSRESSVSSIIDLLPEEIETVGVDRRMIATLEKMEPTVVIIDQSTDFDVVRVCRDIHESVGSRLVVLGVNGSASTEHDIVSLMDAGADHYLPRDTSIDVLLAHVRVALRAGSPRRPPPRLIVGDVSIDVEAHEVLIAGKPVSCRPRHFALLVELARNPNRVVRSETLLTRVWNVEPGFTDTGRLRIAVSRLRSALGRGANRPQIETVARIGYRLVVINDDETQRQ